MFLKQFIFIITDTQRYDMLGCCGNPVVQTPELDRLAASGALFERAYTVSPVCGPARSSLFTGIPAHSNGSWTNSMPLGANVRTVGKRIADAGIKSAYIGKWHLDGSDYFGLGQCPEGWDSKYWYDMRCYLEELSPEQRKASRKPETCYQPWFDETFTYGYRCTTRALDFIEEHKEQDFLLVVSYDEPHDPYLCPAKFFEMYKDKGLEWPKKKNLDDNLQDKPDHHTYYAKASGLMGREPVEPVELIWRLLGCNSFVDNLIGRLYKRAEEVLAAPCIMYTSDHGCHAGAHRLVSKGASMYEENIHIPLLLQHPGVSKGQRYPHPVSHLDIVPSIGDFFGLEPSPVHGGSSLLSVVSKGSKDLNTMPSIQSVQAVHAAVFSEFHRYEVDHDGFGGFQPIRCAIGRRYKLVINLLSSCDEFYDLDQDPAEMVNLIDEPSLQQEKIVLHKQLLAWMNDTRDPFRGYQWQCRPWRQDVSPDWANDGMTRQRIEDDYEPRQLDYGTGLEIAEATRAK